MTSETHVFPSDKRKFYLYFSLYDPITEDSQPSKGRVGWVNFDQRVFSLTYDGKIRGIAVYDRKLTSDEMIAFGLHSDYSQYECSDNQIELVTAILEAERQWCEVKPV